MKTIKTIHHDDNIMTNQWQYNENNAKRHHDDKIITNKWQYNDTNNMKIMIIIKIRPDNNQIRTII